MKRIFAFLLCGLCGFLGACANAPGDDPALAAPATPVALPVGSIGSLQTGALAPIVALPPSVGAIANVRERLYPNGLKQVATLVGPAGNDIEISIGRKADGLGRLYLGAPTSAGIAQEILSRFPGFRMAVVTRPMFNSLGRFGLAIGRDANGMRCVFAWQWLGDARDAETNRWTIQKSFDSLAGAQLPAALRIRLCRPDMTLDQLAGAIEGLTVVSQDNLRRAIARAESASSGASGMGYGLAPVVAPTQLSLESALGPAPPLHPIRPLAAASAAPARPSEPRRAFQSRSAPARPHRRAHFDSEASAAPNQPRYLAPIGNSAPGGAAPALAPQNSRSAAGPHLPPQAFLGPSAASGEGAGGAISPRQLGPTPIGAAP